MQVNYWTESTDDAIWKYVELSSDLNDEKTLRERDILFRDVIYIPLTVLIESLINKYKLSNYQGTELDVDWLKSECFTKFLEVLNKGYLKKNLGRPFNYITSVMRFHMIAIRKQNQKQKHYLESNYFENEEYIFSEMMDDINIYENNNNLIIDPEESDTFNISAIQYEKIIQYLQEDIKKNDFSSKKEFIFAEQLLEVMSKLHKFDFSNKFFIKFIISELCAGAGFDMRRFTINYYLLKIWTKYKKRMEKEIF
mgnify:FL=1